MSVLSRKVFPIAAIITTSLFPSVWACLELNGSTSDGFSINGDMTATDNGIQTCNGDIVSGDANLACISGYSLNYDYGDNPQEGPLPITYCNPENCYDISIPLDCTERNCCEGTIPCICYDCLFRFSTFC